MTKKTPLFFNKNLAKVLLVLLIVFGFSIPYITASVPHCCEDITYLENLPLDGRLSLFWGRTITEGRFIFAIITAILSGHITTNLFAFISILSTGIIAMLIASLWQSEGKIWIAIALLLSLNPFLLMLYPWPISFGIFNIANLILVLSFYCYYKNNRLIFIVPIAVALCLGIYQPTMSFLLQVVFLHFFVRCFNSQKLNLKKEFQFYGGFILATLVGYALYSWFLKILLFIAGVSKIRRNELWHHKAFNNLLDFILYSFDSLKFFINNGISSGIDPAQSVLVGPLSLRISLIVAYQFVLLLIILFLVFQSIYKQSKLQIVLAFAVLPISIIITILPLIISGSGMISRVFYPFGLVLPALLLVQINSKNKFSIKFNLIAWLLSLILIIIMSAFQTQVFHGMVNEAKFAKAQHQEMLNRLFMMPNYNLKTPILIYPYVPHKDDKPDIGGNFWPLLNGLTYINEIIKYNLGYQVNMISVKNLEDGEVMKIEDFIIDQKINPWPNIDSINYMPNLRGGTFIIYYPYNLALEERSVGK